MSDFSISPLIRHELAEHVGEEPSKVAVRVAQRIKPADRQKVMLLGLTELVRIEIGRERMTSRQKKATGRAWHDKKPGDLMHFVQGQWKALRDCTLSDVDWLAASHREQAQQHEALAMSFANLAAQMRDIGALVVGSLADVEPVDETQTESLAA